MIVLFLFDHWGKRFDNTGKKKKMNNPYRIEIIECLKYERCDDTKKWNARVFYLFGKIIEY